MEARAGRSERLEPVVRIGVLDGPDSYVFGRIFDVALGPDNAVYVLDAQAAAVRVFNLNGEHLRTIGGPGQGPEELGGPYSLAFDAEGLLWVADERNRRYTAYSPLGELVQTVASPIQGGLARGRIRWTRRGTLFDIAFVSGTGRSVLSLSLHGDPVIQDAVALPTWVPPGLFRTAETGEQLLQTPSFAPRLTQDFTATGRVWIGTSDSYVLHQISLDGDTVRTVSRSVAAVPLSGKDQASLDDWIAEVRAQGYDEGDETQLPREFPFFERIVVADDGYLWIYRGAAAPGEFDIFDPEGEYLGSVATTLDAGRTGVHPQVTTERIVGVATDSLGVQFVEVSEIVRR